MARRLVIISAAARFPMLEEHADVCTVDTSVNVYIGRGVSVFPRREECIDVCAVNTAVVVEVSNRDNANRHNHGREAAARVADKAVKVAAARAADTLDRERQTINTEVNATLSFRGFTMVPSPERRRHW